MLRKEASIRKCENKETDKYIIRRLSKNKYMRIQMLAKRQEMNIGRTLNYTTEKDEILLMNEEKRIENIKENE